ncbi:MAG: hypothetical protein Q9167_008121 [Letrouitia subvulpina]
MQSEDRQELEDITREIHPDITLERVIPQDDLIAEEAADEEAYDIAADLEESRTMDSMECRELFENTVNYWGAACIPCSFVKKELVEGSHNNCVQRPNKASLDQHRHQISFDSGIGCYRCAQPLVICRGGNRNKPCQQPWLAWHCSWTAYNLDKEYGHRLIGLLGGPEVSSGLEKARQSQYYRWLGFRTQLAGISLSNMGLLMFHWLAHLEAISLKEYSTSKNTLINES